MSAPFPAYECQNCNTDDLDDHYCQLCEELISAKQCHETEGICESCSWLLDK